MDRTRIGFCLRRWWTIGRAALAITAKTLVRIPDLDKHPKGFVEYVLIGTLASLLVALTVAVTVRLALGLSPIQGARCTILLPHRFFGQLFSLHLPRGDFAVAGSGPMYVRGMIDELGDVDVIARGRAWEIAVEHGCPVPAPYSTSTVRVVELLNKNVEIFDVWFPEIWKVGDLIDGTDLINGVRFVPLEVVRQTKERMRRPKDIAHLQIIDNYLNRGSR